MSARKIIKLFLRETGLSRPLRFIVYGGVFRILDTLADAVGWVMRDAQKKLPRDRLSRILVIRLDRIGDVVLSTPALRAIKESFPASHVAVLVRRATKDIVEGLPFVDEIITREDFSKDGLAGYLKKSRFVVSVALHPGWWMNYLPWSAGIPFRIGYKFCGSGIFLTKDLPDDRAVRVRHEVASALEVVGQIGAMTHDTSLVVAVHEEGEAFAEDFLQKNGLVQPQKFAVIHPGARQEHIRWKKEGFAAVADRLISEKGLGVILSGSEEERALLDAVRSLMKERCVVAVGWDLKSLISLIKRAALFVGNSTGPMHLAAALGVPVAAIFGAVHPLDSEREWGPWSKKSLVISKDLSCKRCHPSDCATFDCMESIAPQEVFEAASKLLEG
jgi:heptosyltransferase-2